MVIKQLYTGCISEAAYYIESNGEAAVIDPLRDIDSYVQLAKDQQAIIKYIFETHFHADFVSGHLDLAKATGATIVYGPQTEANFSAYIAEDNEEFKIGAITLTALHTPGHTLESTCYLLKDEEGKPHSIYTGDTLFVGDVGRPDLAQKDSGHTMDDLAAMLYDSLQNKIIPLDDDLIVYPAHGQGSSCGKNLSAATSSTIGAEKRTNYALQVKSKEEFVKVVTEGLSKPPEYFSVNAKINKEGYDSIDTVLKEGLHPLSIKEAKDILAKEELLLVDTRPSALFTQGFIPGAINIGLDGRFAEWAGSLLPFDKPIALVTETGKEQESITRLARVGFSKMRGYVTGGFEAWQAAGEPVDLIIDIEADELAMDLPFDENLVVMDVRRPTEFADGHIKDAVNIPLDEFTDIVNIANIEEHQNVYLHCGSGYRSVIAASLLKRQGVHNLRNVVGGWNSIKNQKGIEVVKDNSVLN